MTSRRKKKGDNDIFLKSPLRLSLNQYHIHIKNTIEQNTASSRRKSIKSRETIKLGIKKLEESFRNRLKKTNSAERLKSEKYMLWSLCGLSDDKSETEQAEYRLYLEQERLKRGEKETESKKIPWEIVPILDALVEVRMGTENGESNRTKTGDALAELILRHISKELQSKDESVLRGDYRARMMLSQKAIQAQMLHGFEEAWKLRVAFLEERLKNLNPLDAMGIIRRFCVSLDILSADAIQMRDAPQKEKLSYSSLQMIIIELLSFRTIANKCFDTDDSDEAKALKSYLSETEYEQRMLGGLYNDYLLSLLMRQEKEKDKNSVNVDSILAPDFLEQYCSLRRYFNPGDVKWNVIESELWEYIQENICNLFDDVKKMMDNSFVSESRFDSSHSQSLAETWLQNVLQNLRYDLFFCFTYLRCYYSIVIFFTSGRDVNEYNVGLLIDRLDESREQLQKKNMLLSEELEQAKAGGMPALCQFYANETSKIFGEMTQKDEEMLMTLLYSRDGLTLLQKLNHSKSQTEIYSKLFASRFAQDGFCDTLEHLKKTHLAIQNYEKSITQNIK